jgi:peptidyl-tRNA hydrolase
MSPTIYLIMRKDLFKLHNWTAGSILAQAGHVCCKLMVEHSKNDKLQKYLQNTNEMVKVVLSVKNKSQLALLREELQSEGILYSTWTEMPEDQEICIATIPYEPQEIRHLLKRCSLYK